MTDGNGILVVPAAEILRRAGGEIDELSARLCELERLVCDTLAVGPCVAADQVAQLQSFDMMAQRLRGLSACLQVVAGVVTEEQVVSLAVLRSVLPLGVQRATLLGQGAAQQGAPPPELF